MTSNDIHCGGPEGNMAGAMLPMEFEGAPVRIVNRGDELWFVAKDVAEVLGYARPDNAISQHCKAVETCPLDSGGQVRHFSIIPERDVYRLIFRSKLPAAERFEEWVVGEVLPAIRKTGSYSAHSANRPLTVEDVCTIVETKVASIVPAIAKAFAREFTALRVAEERYSIGEGMTAGDVIELAGVTNRKGLRGLPRFVTSRLERLHKRRGTPMREGRLGGARATLYDPKLCREWLREGGLDTINRYIAERRGQGKLSLVGVASPKM